MSIGHWVLLMWATGHGFAPPIDMPSVEICQKAASQIDDKTANIWTGCLNTSTGEFIVNVR